MMPWFRRHRPPGRRMQPDILLDNDVGRPADQNQMFDIVAPYQHQPAMAVDRRRVHDRQSRLAVSAAGDKCPECQSAHHAYDHKNDQEQNQCSQSPDHRRGVFRSGNAFQPSAHLVDPLVASFRKNVSCPGCTRKFGHPDLFDCPRASCGFQWR